MKATEHELWQDERAAALRKRDRQREPSAGRLFIGKPGHAPPRTLRLKCPTCDGPVFVMADSADEPADCTNPSCLDDLVTRRGPDDEVRLEVADFEMAIVHTPDSDGVS